MCDIQEVIYSLKTEDSHPFLSFACTIQSLPVHCSWTQKYIRQTETHVVALLLEAIQLCGHLPAGKEEFNSITKIK